MLANAADFRLVESWLNRHVTNIIAEICQVNFCKYEMVNVGVEITTREKGERFATLATGNRSSAKTAVGGLHRKKTNQTDSPGLSTACVELS
jgi:hypothetical protein